MIKTESKRLQIESEATGEPLWQRRALVLTDRILEQFMADNGALAMTTNSEHLLIELNADIEAAVRTQACNDQVCLPPSDLPMNVER